MAEEIVGGSFVLNTDDLRAGVAEAKKQFSLLDSEARKVQSAFDDWTKSQEGLSAEIDKLRAKLAIQRQTVAAYEKQLESVRAKENASAAEIRNAEKQLNDAQTAYNRLQRALNKYEGQLDDITASQRRAEASTDSLTDSQESLQRAAGVLDTVLKTGIVLTIGHAMVEAASAGIRALVEYESAFTDVRKTVDGTEQDFETLNSEINRMAREMPQSAAEIAQVVALGGQLGIAVDDLSEFARTMIMLGDSTDVTAESAAEMIAQLGNITGLQADEYERFGSTLVALGNSSAATESAILEMANRIARFGASVGLTNQDILALSSALASMGIEAEAGSSSIQRLFSDMTLAVSTGSKELEGFSEAAGLSVDEFSSLFREDALGALTAFIGGLRTAEESGADTIVTLSELGLTDVRLSQTIQALSAGYSTLTSSLEQADQAWQDNTALEREAEARYSTLESQIEITRNRINELGRTIAGTFAPALSSIISSAGNVASAITGFIDPLKGSEIILGDTRTAVENYRESLQKTPDAIDEVTEAQRALNQQLVFGNIQKLADSYEALVDEVEASTRAVTGGQEQLVNLTQGGVNTVAGDLFQIARQIDGSIYTLDEAINLARNIMTSPIADDADVYLIEELNQAWLDYNTTGERLATTETNVAAVQERQTEIIRELATYVDEGIIGLGLLRTTNEDLAAAVEAYLPQMQEEAERQQELARIYEESATAQEAHLANQQAMMATEEAFQSVIQMSIDYWQSMLDSVESGTDEYAEYSARLDVCNKALSELGQKTKTATGSVEGLNGEMEKSSALDLASVISRYGTEEEKLALQTQTIIKEIAALREEMNSPSPSGTIEQYIQAISILERALVDLEQVSGTLDLSAIIGEYGTDAEKRALQIQTIKEEIAALRQEMSTPITADSLENYSKAIDILERELANLEDTGNAFVSSMNKVIEAFSGTSEISKAAASFQQAFTLIADPVTDTFSGIMETAGLFISNELDAINNQLSQLEKASSAAIEAMNATYETQQDKLEDMYESGEITQAEYYRRLAASQEEQARKEQELNAQKEKDEEALLKKKDELQRKQFEAEKANAIADIWISAAQAIMQAWASNWILGAVMTGVIGGIATAQTIAVAQQQYVPALAEGGIVDHPTLALIGEAGDEAVMPLKNNTEWIGVLGEKLATALERRGEQAVYNNNDTTDNRSYVINQQIAPSHIPTRREAYLQARKALREVK